MKFPPIPADEPERLIALQRARILDTPREPAFDELVHQAARICGTPIALLSFVAERRLWVKASLGIPDQEIPRDIALCAHTITEETALEVSDTHQDQRFFDSPLVVSPPFIRAYTGVPIRNSGRHAIGALCVADIVPRVLNVDQRELLQALARQAATLIELRCMAETVAARAEEALAAKAQLESERALLSGVLRATTEHAVIGCDRSGAITLFNEGAVRLLGYGAHEILGKTPLVLHDAGEVAARAAELGVAPGFEVFVVMAKLGESETREWTYIRKNGGRVPIALTITAMRNETGELIGFLGIARDLTGDRLAERRRTDVLIERAGRAAAERALAWLGRLHTLTVGLAAAVTLRQVVDVLLRQALTTLEGVAGAIAIAREDREGLDVVRFTGEARELDEMAWSPLPVATPIADAVRTRTTVLVENLHPDGRYGALITGGCLAGCSSLAAAPLLLEGDAQPIGGYCLAFAEPRRFGEEDRIFLLALGRVCAQALERARLYEAQSQARGEAESANRTKDEFLSSLSHELRTPLTAVLGWAHILQGPTPEPERLRHGLAVIERNAASQLRLIEDLLDISRIVAGKLELERGLVDLGAIVGSAVEASRPAAEAAGVHLAVTIDPATGPVLGDPDRLQQVVLNLLSNALKFTPRNGRIEVRLDSGNGHARIRMTDTGEGIDPAFLPFLFERFRQADSTRTRTHGGLGLGLAIVRHLVELHGGTITAASEGYGRGATFTVLVPLQGARGQSVEQVESSMNPGDSTAEAQRTQRTEDLFVNDVPKPENEP